MAYQARGRDPFIDSDMQAAIERRGKELLGLLLLVLAGMCVAMLASYSPDDPSWLSATDRPAQNWMGRPGATVAAPLFMILGLGSWAIPLIAAAWGLRLVLHKGEERALGRLIFAPIAVALASVHASTLPPDAGWTHSFGLGGLFGDTVLGSLLLMLPFATSIGVKLLAMLLALAALGALLFVTGCTRAELARFGRFLLVGVVLGYAAIAALTVRAVHGAGALAAQLLHGAVALGRTALSRRQADHEEPPAPASEAIVAAGRPDPAIARSLAAPTAGPEMPTMDPEDRPGFLSRVIGRVQGAGPSDAREGQEHATPEEAGEQDRVRAKIASAIKARARQGASLRIDRAPRLAGSVKAAEGALPPEPPLLGAAGDDLPVPELVEESPAGVPAFRRRPAAPEDQAPRTRVVHPSPKGAAPSRRAKAEAQPQLAFEATPGEYDLPPLSLLSSPVNIARSHLSDDALAANARMLETVLDDYGVKGEIVSVRPGPVVTMYELEPAPGIKASRVIGLSDDIARSMSALSARVSTVPGRSVIGIELPNEHREIVSFREILSSRAYGDGRQKLPLALGKDIAGEPVVADLARMPHLLIAGTTGSGKSVAINTMILSLLYKLTPDQCRLIMIDPKMLELSVYDGIPHLLSPVVTDPKKAVVALKWVVAEMEERYRKMSKMGVRNIDGYNSRVEDALSKGQTFSRTVQTGFDDETGEPIFETEEIVPEKMPYIVVIVDEMADLMMVAGKEIEACIQRLAQMARASGIHLIMATQRPSVDVITGTIKANFPTRISFQVTSKIDSRTILGEQGAEQLLGMGDMLYMSGGARIMRCHGPFVSDEEVEEIVRHLKAFGPPTYVSGVIEGPDDEKADAIDQVLGLGGNTDGEDALYDQAVAIVLKDRKCSTSYIQRKLAIGYNKAARLVEQMEDEGIVSPANHVGKREILVPERD